MDHPNLAALDQKLNDIRRELKAKSQGTTFDYQKILAKLAEIESQINQIHNEHAQKLLSTRVYNATASNTAPPRYRRNKERRSTAASAL
ncbi:hypothetical protein RUND412_007858 [Rhizina undulata]